jgi:glycosyltransferase involved in cell wall biosynthesis
MADSGAHDKSILLVAMFNSVHTTRWVKQLMDQDWKIYLFPSTDAEKLHSHLSGVVIVRSNYRKVRDALSALGLGFLARLVRYFERKLSPHPAKQLRNVIVSLQPDLIHSLEIQAAGYLTLEAKNKFHGKFPPWIVTNWGSDIFLFGKLQRHKEKIHDVLASCDYYSCECERDVKLALEFGFSKTVLPVFPNTGGFELRQLEKLRHEILPSSRKVIMLKGYQHWAGRALTGLRALERCEDVLGGYTIVIFSAPPEVEMAAELLTYKTGIATRIISHDTTHQEMLSLHAKARISIGLSISDAISTSLLEAMVMGSFPIQSCTACADEWVQHGVSGMIVPPEDTEVIEKAIRMALAEDGLVDKAAEINWQVALTRLDGALLKQKATDIYRSILK